jgi:hypothetical protein
MSYPSFSQTVTQKAQPLRNALTPGLNFVKQYTIVVRNMDTATYIAFGGPDGQNRRLNSVGQSISISPAYGNLTVSIESMFVISDAGSPVIEILAEA